MFKTLKKIITKKEDTLKKTFNILEDDIFLVSYPKSGNTWVRFLLCNYLSEDYIDFSNSNRLIPDVHYNPEQIKEIQTRPRFIKSHLPFNHDYKNVIYILRDGRDVSISYYYYQIFAKEIDEKLTFYDYFYNYFLKEGSAFGRWGEHVKSWQNNKINKILFIRYEDLMLDCEQTFTRILDFTGLEKDQNKIQKAVMRSSFENMKIAESYSHKLIYEEREMKKTGYGFMRKGISGDWKNHFDNKMLDTFNIKYSCLMKELSYY
jgi:hypothetical protein